MKRWLARIAKVNVYELMGTTIILHHGWLPRESVTLPQIISWRVAHEMGFDIVTLDIGGDGVLTWLDWDNDLLAILRIHCADLQQS